MKSLYAIVREKGSKDYIMINREYASKKAFYEDLHMNGYIVRTIYTKEQWECL